MHVDHGGGGERPFALPIDGVAKNEEGMMRAECCYTSSTAGQRRRFRAASSASLKEPCAANDRFKRERKDTYSPKCKRGSEFMAIVGHGWGAVIKRPRPGETKH